MSTSHNKLNELNKIKRNTDFKTRLEFINAHVISRILYMLPTYMNATSEQKNKIHKVIMRAARMIIGSYCLMKSTTYIFGKCNWLTTNQMIEYAATKEVHKIIYN